MTQSAPALSPDVPAAPHEPHLSLRKQAKWLLVLLAVVGAFGLHRHRKAETHAAVFRYETVAIDRGPLVAKVTATGTLSALVTVQVGSQVSGRIEGLYTDFARTVHKGQRIAAIEPGLFRAAVQQAHANHQAAAAAVDRARAQVLLTRRQHERTRALVESNVATRSDLDSAEAAHAAADADLASALAAVAQTRAALDQAMLNLRYTTIVSPIDGVVLSRNVDVGQIVAAAFQAPTLFTIAQDLTAMQVDTSIAEADVGKLRSGMDVTFTVDAYPHREFTGTVRQIRDNAQTIQNVVTYDAVVDVTNADLALKPGMTASATFVHARRADAVRVPNAALRFKPDARMVSETGAGSPSPAGNIETHTVWVLEAGRVRPRQVRLGLSDGTSTEVLGDELRPGERAVIEAIAAKESP